MSFTNGIYWELLQVLTAEVCLCPCTHLSLTDLSASRHLCEPDWGVPSGWYHCGTYEWSHNCTWWVRFNCGLWRGRQPKTHTEGELDRSAMWRSTLGQENLFSSGKHFYSGTEHIHAACNLIWCQVSVRRASHTHFQLKKSIKILFRLVAPMRT